MNPIAAKALELFAKKFGRKILKSAADNKWVADMIKKLKAPPKPGVLFKGKSKDYKGIESIKPENLNASNSSRFVESAKKEAFKGWTPRVIKGGKKAEGGIITVSDPGMGDGPFMMEEFLEAVKKGFKGTYDDYIDQIDRSPRDYLAEGGSTQKDIDKGLKAIEKLKSSLMPESYEELIEIYKDKQKDLNIDIMESAGGLGEMLGEGGRVGMQGGGWPFWLLKMLGKAKDSPWTKKKAIPYMKDKLNKNKIKEFFNKDIVEELDKAGRKLRVDASLGNPMPNWPLNLGIGSVGLATLAHFLLKKANQEGEYPEYRLDRDSTKYWDFQDLLKEEGLKMGEMDKIKLREEKGRNLFEGLDYEDRAQGGRVGMMYGGDPGFAFSYGGSWADWKDNHASEMPLMDYINQKLPKARNPFSDSSYQDGGPVHELDGLALSIFQKPYAQLTSSEQSALDNFKPEADEPIPKAEGGRIGLGSGTSPKIIENRKRNLYFDLGRDNFMNMFEYLQSGLSQNDYDGKYKKGGRVGFQEGTGIMSQTGIPYYADKAVEGIVNSAETLFKLPFAAGKLGSQLLQSPPDKKMFTDALENITPGSWSKNLGISSLAEAEGAKVSDKQRAIGDVLGLGTEIAVPVGGAFKIGQKIIDQASKAMGKLKKGKTLDQTINDKITDFGQSRRDFNILAGTSGLMVALKAIGLGGLLKGSSKKAEDFMVTLKTTIDDSDVMGDIGPEATAKWAGGFDIKSLTPKGSIIMNKILGKRTDDLGRETYRYTNKEAYDSMKASKGKTAADKQALAREINDLDTEEALDLVEEIKKAGGNMKFDHWDDTGGRSVDELLASFKKTFGENSGEYKRLLAKFKKMTEKEKVKYHSAITDDYNQSWDNSGSVDEILDLIYGKGKAEGGSVGYPPIQLGPLDLTPRASGGFSQGQPYGPNLRQKTWSDNIGIGGVLDLPGGFNLTGEYDKYRTKDRLYTADDEYLDKRVRDDHDRWKLGLQWKKKFAKGGKAWRPKSAPQLTTTIPPESGPMPQGLTYLTGDDIVQNIGHKHGRN